MFAPAIAEFEFTLIFADAPVDRFARGDPHAMNEQQKRGALIFFGKGKCSQCHSVAGQSNEMFSDFQMHVIGVPQIAPEFGIGKGNVLFDGPGQDEDFGLEQVTGNAADRYKFRSSPLRNAALQPAFFHNGAMTRIEDAIYHHLDVFGLARSYDPKKAGVDKDLRYRLGPIEPGARSASTRSFKRRSLLRAGSSRPWSRSSAMRCWMSAQRAKVYVHWSRAAYPAATRP